MQRHKLKLYQYSEFPTPSSITFQAPLILSLPLQEFLPYKEFQAKVKNPHDQDCSKVSHESECSKVIQAGNSKSTSIPTPDSETEDTKVL